MTEPAALALKSIRRFYNPTFQRIIIERAIDGEPANDLVGIEDRAKPCPLALLFKRMMKPADPDYVAVLSDVALDDGMRFDGH